MSSYRSCYSFNFAAPSVSRGLELPVKLTIPDRNIELLTTAMQADLEAGSPTGPLYGES